MAPSRTQQIFGGYVFAKAHDQAPDFLVTVYLQAASCPDTLAALQEFISLVEDPIHAMICEMLEGFLSVRNSGRLAVDNFLDAYYQSARNDPSLKRRVILGTRCVGELVSLLYPKSSS